MRILNIVWGNTFKFYVNEKRTHKYVLTPAEYCCAIYNMSVKNKWVTRWHNGRFLCLFESHVSLHCGLGENSTSPSKYRFISGDFPRSSSLKPLPPRGHLVSVPELSRAGLSCTPELSLALSVSAALKPHLTSTREGTTSLEWFLPIWGSL